MISSLLSLRQFSDEKGRNFYGPFIKAAEYIVRVGDEMSSLRPLLFMFIAFDVYKLGPD